VDSHSGGNHIPDAATPVVNQSSSEPLEAIAVRSRMDRAAEPKLMTEEAQKLKITTLLGAYRTNYRVSADKSLERVENLKIASKAINGTLLAPGGLFSANEVLSPLVYYEAMIIRDGVEETTDGGGICQATSTLYMAANYAGLEIVERHPHSLQLPYIQPGFDAMIWFELGEPVALDMKFKNNTDSYVLIREWVAADNYIYAEIWGRPTGRKVEMDSKPEYVGADKSKWVTYKKVKEHGKVVFDGIFNKDTYNLLVDDKGRPILTNSENLLGTLTDHPSNLETPNGPEFSARKKASAPERTEHTKAQEAPQ
jgi:vancomycin resistance protein YoaR